MAGMLPGVEAARRRRIHQSSGLSSSPSSRRPSFSLFSTSTNTNSSVPSLQRSRACQVDDEKLGQLARQAKERLDERLLRSQRKSQILRNNSDLEQRRSRSSMRELRTEVYGTKKKLMGMGMGWGKLGWKTWEQKECAVCLEEFKVGENLVNMPCEHRFHSRCLVPWLETNAHCPCCRMSILS